VEPENNLNCICVIESDIKVDFVPPLDYKEPDSKQLLAQAPVMLDEEQDG